MDGRWIVISVLIALALGLSMIAAGITGIVLLALIATTLTVGLRTGSLAPYYPAISRTDTPAKFWLVMAACFVVVLVNIFNLFWRS
jgi:hypothetical protein